MNKSYEFLRELYTTPFWNIEYTRGAMLAKQVHANLIGHTPMNDTMTMDKTTQRMEVRECYKTDVQAALQ